MKRNNIAISLARRARKSERSSRYAAKVSQGQMYGPGCCGHRLTASQIYAAKERARNEGFVTSYSHAERGHSI